MFLSIDPSHVEISEMSNTQLNYIEQFNDDGVLESICMIGEDAFKFANIFGKELRRPMEKGTISARDIDAAEIIGLMIKKMIGEGDNGYCVYSIPADAVDADDIAPVVYHEKVFKKLFNSLGYEAVSLNEGLAVVFSECSDNNFSGIGLSFGCGMTNICMAWKGIPTLAFSVARGGDWIDNNAAKASANTAARTMNLKEKKLDLSLTKINTDNKSEKRTLEALKFFYGDLIEHVLENFIEQFENASEGLSIDEEIPIIISGGTSLPNGFIELFEDTLRGYGNKFPYKIKEVRRASDPLMSVAKGSLIYAKWKLSKEQ
jgi:hypothetical protein